MKYKKLAIKIGSNILARENGLPDHELMAGIVDQISDLKKRGTEVLLISSGAVAFGLQLVKLPEQTDPVAGRQILASVGQVKVVEAYDRLFQKHGIQVAQVIVTREDFRDRRHYLNMKNCLQALLQNDIIPVINENDVVSVTELMFTDNDELAGLVAGMMDFPALLILTNVDGIYDRDPNQKGAKIIEVANANMDFSKMASSGKSKFGRGGMITKCNMALKTARLGIDVYIANGAKANIIPELAEGNSHGTFFPAFGGASGVKKWVAQSAGFVKGRVHINQGAMTALLDRKATSLLPVGITQAEGDFRKGDIVRIHGPGGQKLGLGKTQYGSESLRDKIGKKNQRAFIHYDYLYIE